MSSSPPLAVKVSPSLFSQLDQSDTAAATVDRSISARGPILHFASFLPIHLKQDEVSAAVGPMTVRGPKIPFYSSAGV